MAHDLIDVFEKTLQKSTDWVREVMEELGWSDSHRALGALRTVIHAVRDRLPLGEAAALAAEMPMLIRGLYFEGWRPLEEMPALRRREEFLDKLERGLGVYGLHGEESITEVASAVLRVLNRHVSRGEVEDARHALPADLRTLWPSAAARL